MCRKGGEGMCRKGGEQEMENLKAKEESRKEDEETEEERMEGIGEFVHT